MSTKVDFYLYFTVNTAQVNKFSKGCSSLQLQSSIVMSSSFQQDSLQQKDQHGKGKFIENRIVNK